MAVVTILEEQTVVYDEENGCFIVATNPLVVDETYTVAWNGVEYECVAFGFESGAGVVTTAIGNQVVVNDEDNGMPFTIAYADAENSGLGTPGYEIVFLDGSTTATLAIYQAANDEEPEEPEEEEHIVLKDRNGNDILFQGINMIKLPTTSGGTKTFAACDDVEKTVEPDFSGGDFVVLPDTGTLLSKVTVERPEALLPENIRKGKEIAGVTGDFIGDTESVTVELALADGDQTVSPSADGKVISGVTIKKPETLTPANIAKGVEIAGVEGTLDPPEKYLEYTLNDNGDIVSAALHGFEIMPDGCFAYLDKLETVDLSGSPGLTSIGQQAFRGCAALKSVTLPDTITSIGKSAFYQCTSLTEVNIPDGVTSIEDYTFYGCKGLTELPAHNCVTSICQYAFATCSGLKDVTMSDSVISIGERAFYQSENIVSVKFSANLETIGAYSFYSSTNLMKITIPASVTTIGAYAFPLSSVSGHTVVFEDTTTWTAASSSATVSISSSDLANTTTAAKYLRIKYKKYTWTKT